MDLAQAREYIARLDAAAEHHSVPFAPERVMRWRVFGKGDPVVLIHGGHGSWLHWVRNIEALASDHRVLVPDLPGFGDSHDLAPGSGMPELVTAFIASLDTLLGGRSEIGLAAFSFGAAVAARVALERGAIRRLALLGAARTRTPQRPRAPLIRWRKADAAEQEAAFRHNLLAHMLYDERNADALALEVYVRSIRATRFRSRGTSGDVTLADTLRPYRGAHAPDLGGARCDRHAGSRRGESSPGQAESAVPATRRRRPLDSVRARRCGECGASALVRSDGVERVRASTRAGENRDESRFGRIHLRAGRGFCEAARRRNLRLDQQADDRFPEPPLCFPAQGSGGAGIRPGRKIPAIVGHGRIQACPRFQDRRGPRLRDRPGGQRGDDLHARGQAGEADRHARTTFRYGLRGLAQPSVARGRPVQSSHRDDAGALRRSLRHRWLSQQPGAPFHQGRRADSVLGTAGKDRAGRIPSASHAWRSRPTARST